MYLLMQLGSKLGILHYYIDKFIVINKQIWINNICWDYMIIGFIIKKCLLDCIPLYCGIYGALCDLQIHLLLQLVPP